MAKRRKIGKKGVDEVNEVAASEPEMSSSGQKEVLTNSMVEELKLDSSLTKSQKEFLAQHGSQAKRVSIKASYLTSRQFDPGFLRKLLITGLPHLEELILGFPDPDGLKGESWTRFKKTSLLRENDSLPTLKSLDFKQDFRDSDNWLSKLVFHGQVSELEAPLSFAQILTAAGKLEEIVSVDSFFLPFLEQHGKCGLVKSLRWWNKNAGGHSVSHLMTANQAKLKALILGMGVQLNAVLRACNETIVRLEANPPLAGFDGVTLAELCRRGPSRPSFPKLKHVSVVNVGIRMTLTNSTVVKNEELPGAFPSLKLVIVDCLHLYHNITGDGGLFPSVTTAEFTCYTNKSNFKPYEYGNRLLHGCFPSLSVVKVHWSPEMVDQQEDPLWFVPPKVETIELLDFDLASYRDHGLDELFTGIPREVCKNLDIAGAGKKDSVDVEKLRKREPITRFTNLKLLKFHCKNSDPVTLKGIKFLSHLSRRFSLDSAPDLRLEFTLPGNQTASEQLLKVVQGLMEPIADVCTVYFH